MHTIRAGKIGDRRIVVTIAEVGYNALKVYDATDLSAPVLLGAWQADRTRPNHPQHNIQLLDGRLYLAYCGKGLYVFDLTDLGSLPLADTLTLSPVARYAPPEPRESEDAFYRALGFQNVWDVVISRGLVYVNDVTRGVVVLGDGCLDPGEAAATATLWPPLSHACLCVYTFPYGVKRGGQIAPQWI